MWEARSANDKRCGSIHIERIGLRKGRLRNAELSLVRYDVGGNFVGSVSRADGGSDPGGFDGSGGSGVAVHHHAGCHGPLDGYPGDWKPCGAGGPAHPGTSAISAVYVSASKDRGSGGKKYRGEYHRQCAGIGLGGGSCRASGHERAEEGTGGAGRRKMPGQPGDVHIFDFKYFLSAAYSHEYDCLPQPVRQRESGGHCGFGHRGDNHQHGGGGGVLQGDGNEAGGVNSPTFLYLC